MRKFYTYVLISFLTATTASGLESPFPSTVPGLSTPNAHLIHTPPTSEENENGRIYRSMAPRSTKEFKQAKKLGVTDVLIFKNQIGEEVDVELEILEELGLTAFEIPFLWKDHPSFEEACIQSVHGLRILYSVSKSEKRNLLFHCTVGEDRTGYLAGLWNLLKHSPETSKPEDLERVFKKELCEHGYEAGNPNKPQKVVKAIREHLTPLFLKMAYKIRSSYITEAFIESATETEIRSECSFDPNQAAPALFKWNPAYQSKNYKCEKSPLYPEEESEEFPQGLAKE